jgi:hypothetical protein
VKIFPFQKQVVKFWPWREDGRGEIDWLLFERSNTKIDTNEVKICVRILAITVTLKNSKKKKKKKKNHCSIAFTIFTRQLISSMSLPPEKRRDFTPIP